MHTCQLIPPTGNPKGNSNWGAIRYARMNIFFNKYISQHIWQMHAQDYTSDYITTAIFSTLTQDLKKSYTKVNNRPVFVVRFAASAAKVIKTIRHNWHYIQEDPTVGNLFPHYPIMAFKKNTNLKRFLVCACIKPDVGSEQTALNLSWNTIQSLTFPR